MPSNSPDTPRQAKKMKRDNIPYPFAHLLIRDTDLVIVVEGERFEAHHAIVCAASSVFETMLTNGMRESRSKEIVLDSLKKPTWKLILEFMYTGKIGIMNEETALEVVRFAHQYEMHLLMNMAANKLKGYTTSKNCVERLYLADSLGIPPLRASSLKIIRANFLAISKTSEFKNIPFTILDDILVGNKDLIVPSQLELFCAIIRWTHSSPTLRPWTQLRASPWRIAEAKHLFRHADVSKMDIKEVRALAKHPAMVSFPDIIPYLINAVKPSSIIHGVNAGRGEGWACPCGYPCGYCTRGQRATKDDSMQALEDLFAQATKELEEML